MKKIYRKVHGLFRKLKFVLFSNNKNQQGKFIAHQPVVCNGLGKLEFGNNVNIGVINAPFFLNSYAYIEARTNTSKIIFGNNIHINNSFSVVAEKEIIIKSDVLIGFNCQIIDSNFHDLKSDRRLFTDPNPQKVTIEKNVFIGNNVTILKGVTIGENSVIANSSVVSASIPSNVIAGGIPAKVIRALD